MSRQEERDNELRDENSKLHNKYSEVMLYIMLVENLIPSLFSFSLLTGSTSIYALLNF